MIAPKFRKLSPDEYRSMLKGVQQVIEPFMRAKLEVMQVTMPAMTITRTGTGYTMTARYEPEVQDHFDLCDSMCEQAVQRYLQQEGFVYGSVYGGNVQLRDSHDIHE